ncbi:retrovirus-related pol polyprotein from transposon TNT 1-94 [Tanacetum coccineum]
MASNEETNAAGTDTRPPMLVESDYDSWKIRIHSEEENKLEMADTQAEIILSQGLPRHIFNNLNQTSTAKEIWDNVEMLMQGSGRTIQQRKEDLFDEYERFRAIGNESIHDYFVRFHKLVNDMKITQLNIPTHQMNTKFVNNLSAYWGKYVTNVKQNMDISTTPYVQIYTHLKAYEPHAKKTLKKQEQSTSIVDPLAYVAHTTSAPALSSPSTPSPQPTAQSPNDALMATMTQIANLLSGFQKQFPPTNNQLRTSSNSRTHATVHDGHIVTEPVQRKAPGNNGNTGTRGKKVICYNCRGEGHVARQCKEPKRKMDSQYFKDKALLMEAKEKGDVLDAEAEAFLADVECTAPYDQPQALTTTNMFQANHEDAYDSDVDEGPNAAVAFMANLSSTSATNNPVNEVHSNDNQIFDNVDYQLSQEMHQEEHLDSDAETEIDDNTIPYHQYLLDTEAQNVPTEVSADTSDKVSMIAILTDLQTQLDGHAKVNQEKCLEIETLKNELLQCKQEICRLDTHKVKLDLENKVRQEQALVIQRNKRNAELVQENDLLKSTLSGKEKSIAFLQSEKEKILSEKKDLADSYLDEIVCLKNANKVARDMLQRFNMPTQTIPMLSKKPKKATNDLHKDILGTRNPGLGYMAKRAQPVLYDADTLLHPNHHPVSIWDSEETLNSKLVKEKDAAKTEAALLKAKPSFPNLKELLSKFTNLIGELKELNKYVEKLEVELPRDLKEIPSKIEKFTSIVSSLTTQVAELKTLQWELPAEFLYLPDHVLELASKKTEDHGVPSAGQARNHPTEGEKNTQQVTISLLFQRRIAKDAKKANLNKQPTTTGSPQPEGELIKKEKGKKVMSSKDAKEEDTRSDFDEDANLTGSMVESSKKKKLKKFDFVTVRGYHIYLTAKQIKEQKRIEESVKADLAKQEVELGKDELVDLLGIEVVIGFYKAKLQYEKYYDKMLNRRG